MHHVCSSAVTQQHELGLRENRNFFSRSGCPESRTKVLAGGFPLGSEGVSVLGLTTLLVAVCCLSLVFLGSYRHYCNVTSVSTFFSLCVQVPLVRTPVIALGAYPAPAGPHLNVFIRSAKTLFPVADLGAGLECVFSGDSSTHSIHQEVLKRFTLIE